MKKDQILKKIIATLAANMEVLEKAARASHAEATHESSKAENKYDTRGLEAAYLAGGQARQVRELVEAIEHYSKLHVRDFGPTDAIDLGALVEVEMDGAASLYFVGPKNGGLEIKHQRTEIMVITPESPLGQNLMGRKQGDHWTAPIAGSKVKYKIISVS